MGVLHGCRVQMCSLRACFREQFSSGGLLSFSLPFTSPSPGHGHLSSALSHTSLRGRGAVAVRRAVALLKFSQLLLLLEMKDWRQPAWTSRAGVTAFLARPRAWPALPKPGERPEFHDPECLPSPQGFTKSRLCCRVTCDGQDAGELVLLGCSSGERKVRSSALDAKATGECTLWTPAATVGTNPAAAPPGLGRGIKPSIFLLQ